MNRKINMKDRLVEYFDVDTASEENNIIAYLDRQMRVCFHSAVFNNKKYVFIRGPKDQSANSITVSSYRKKQPGENISVSFQ